MLKLKEVEEIIQNAYNDSVLYCINHECSECDNQCKKQPIKFAIDNIINTLAYYKIIEDYDYQFFRDVFFAHGIDALVLEVYKKYQDKF